MRSLHCWSSWHRSVSHLPIRSSLPLSKHRYSPFDKRGHSRMCSSISSSESKHCSHPSKGQVRRSISCIFGAKLRLKATQLRKVWWEGLCEGYVRVLKVNISMLVTLHRECVLTTERQQMSDPVPVALDMTLPMYFRESSRRLHEHGPAERTLQYKRFYQKTASYLVVAPDFKESRGKVRSRNRFPSSAGRRPFAGGRGFTSSSNHVKIKKIHKEIPSAISKVKSSSFLRTGHLAA
jgi:hypothetical protein